ncbi:MAG: ABC transporter permease [Dokdonella sp.]
MVPLARKTLIYEWRRFLPSALAVAFSGLLLMVQAALVFGIFNTAAINITTSNGDLWVGYPGTQSMELGRPLAADTELQLLMDPGVARVEPLAWLDGDWRGPAGRGGVTVFMSGIDTRPNAMMFADAITPALRAKLDEPGSVIVDRSDLNKLGVNVGDTASLNGQRVHVVAAMNGLRALGGVNVLISLANARQLDEASRADRFDYFLIKLRDQDMADVVKARLNSSASATRFAVWTRDEFARKAVYYWMFETGAGLGVVFLALVVFLVGAIITSQTLMGAVAGSMREYATLHALGVGMRELRGVVVRQAGWVGLFGLAIGGIGTLLVLALAATQDVPAQLDPLTALACAALVMGIALVSGLLAVRVLRRADPVQLLR